MASNIIYSITNIINGKKYIGSTINGIRRWKSHISELRRNKHRNIYLQNSWNKYGEDNFIFDIIEEYNHVHRVFLLWREGKYIKLFNTLCSDKGIIYLSRN